MGQGLSPSMPSLPCWPSCSPSSGLKRRLLGWRGSRVEREWPIPSPGGVWLPNSMDFLGWGGDCGLYVAGFVLSFPWSGGKWGAWTWNILTWNSVQSGCLAGTHAYITFIRFESSTPSNAYGTPLIHLMVKSEKPRVQNRADWDSFVLSSCVTQGKHLTHSLSFLICKMGMMPITPWDCWEAHLGSFKCLGRCSYLPLQKGSLNKIKWSLNKIKGSLNKV